MKTRFNVFSRPYLSNGRAVVMVVVRLFVRQSVTYVLRLNGAR